MPVPLSEHYTSDKDMSDRVMFVIPLSRIERTGYEKIQEGDESRS